MRKYLVLLSLLSFGVAFCQELPMKYDKKTKAVFQDGQRLSMDEMFVKMRPNETAFNYIKSARDCKFFSAILGGVGGVGIGIPVGYFLVTGDFKWPIFAAGVGLVGVSVGLHFRGLKQTSRAVGAYNEGLDPTSMKNWRLDLGYGQNGVGLVLSF